jgi:hypothetical protein
MREALFELWQLVVLVAIGGFVFAYVWDSLFPSNSDDD